MSVIKKGAVLISALAILVSTTGISVQMHRCDMAGKTSRVLFPEIFGIKGSCCCADISSASQKNERGVSKVGTIPCCRNSFTFSKIPSYFSQSINFSGAVKSLLGVAVLSQIIISPEIVRSALPVFYWPPPSIFFGKKLICLIHQIKIPFPF